MLRHCLQCATQVFDRRRSYGNAIAQIVLNFILDAVSEPDSTHWRRADER